MAWSGDRVGVGGARRGILVGLIGNHPSRHNIGVQLPTPSVFSVATGCRRSVGLFHYGLLALVVPVTAGVERHPSSFDVGGQLARPQWRGMK